MSIRDLRDLKNKIIEEVGKARNGQAANNNGEQEKSSAPGRQICPMVKFSDLVDFFYAKKIKHPEVCRCSIFIEDITRMEMGAHFRIQQSFLDSQGNPVYSGIDHKSVIGRIYFAREICSDLLAKYTEHFSRTGEHSVFFEI